MCTLIVGHHTPSGESLIVGANRDESLDRASSPPSIVEEGDLGVLAPRDELAGGTWLGINETSLFAGLTNRFAGLADPERRSRGEIVFRALESPTAREAVSAIGRLEATDYNPFHLVVADAETAHVVVSDGELLTRSRLPEGFAVVTERSFGAADNGRKRRLLAELDRRERQQGVGLDDLRELLSERRDGIDGVCIEMPEMDYGTRSSTLIRLGEGGGLDDSEFWHAEGPPCEVDYEDLSDLVRVLGIG